MSSSSEHRDRWLERELRNVPLPEGMLARLKQVAAGSDAQFDAALCDVELPANLLGRLKAVSRNERFDEKLRDVELPDDLLAKLHVISVYSDDEIDHQLCDVDLPAGLQDRLSAIARPRIAWTAWRGSAVARLALAASLLVAVGTIFFTAMTAAVWSVYHPADAGEAVALDTQQPVDLYVEFETVDAQLLLDPAADDTALAGDLAGEVDSLTVAAPEEIRVPHGLFDDVVQLFAGRAGSGDDPLTDVFLAKYDDLMTNPTGDTIPELQSVRPLVERGVAPASVKAYPRLKLIRDGVHPFVEPDADPALKTSRVPLVTTSDSYQQTWKSLAQGRLPPPGEIRTEEFLAAVNYGLLPPEQQALGVRTAAGPSPLSDPELSMLQVGVKARRVDSMDRRPVYLTIAVDASSSMRQEDQLDRIRHALSQLVRQLGPRDRLSLVTFSEYAQVLFEHAGEDQRSEMTAAIQTIAAHNSTNLGAGLQVASHTALSVPVGPGFERRLVLLTDGSGALAAEDFERLEWMVADIARQGVTLEVVDTNPDGPRDDRLASLAQAGGGSLRAVSTSEAIQFSLMEILTGQSQWVARDALLEVTFNPQAVARYRLLGHEADAVGSLVAGKLAAELRGGQEATALFELELKPGGGDELATVKLTWRDPATDRRHVVEQRISRLQLATSLLESPLPLQRAVLAAEAAEILRQSPYAPNHSSGMRRVLELADELHPRARDDASVNELLALVELAQGVLAGKPKPRTPRDLWWWRRLPRP